MPLVAKFFQQRLELGDFVGMLSGEVVLLADVFLQVVEFHRQVVIRRLVVFFRSSRTRVGKFGSFLAPKQVKTSRGASFEPPARAPLR